MIEQAEATPTFPNPHPPSPTMMCDFCVICGLANSCTMGRILHLVWPNLPTCPQWNYRRYMYIGNAMWRQIQGCAFGTPG